jgi:hypothetical protein
MTRRWTNVSLDFVLKSGWIVCSDKLTFIFCCAAEWATKDLLRKTKQGEEIKSGARRTLHRTHSKIQEALETGELEVMRKPEWVTNNNLRKSTRSSFRDAHKGSNFSDEDATEALSVPAI